MMILKNKGYILGYKSAAGCLLPSSLEPHIFLPNKNVTIIDLIDQKSALLSRLSRHIKSVQKRSRLPIFPKSL